MTRVQILILAILSIVVCFLFGMAAVLAAQNGLLSPASSSVARQAGTDETQATALLTPTATATSTPIPTSTFTPTPTETPLPTATYTRVVIATDTATPSATPTPGPTETNTPSSTASSSEGSVSTPRPTPAPTSRYELKVVDGPVSKETRNYMFVVYARITGSDGNTLLPGYQMVGTHTPTGVTIQSEPSCDYLCRASGPRMENYYILEGNLVFEAYFYDTGTWSLVVLDPQGQQASEMLEIGIDITKRRWFYYHLSK